MPEAKLNHPDERLLLRRVAAYPIPTDASSNRSHSFTYTVNGQIDVQTVIVDGGTGGTYTRQWTWNASLLLSSVDEWVET
jgi:hypothetical protein